MSSISTTRPKSRSRSPKGPRGTNQRSKSLDLDDLLSEVDKNLFNGGGGRSGGGGGKGGGESAHDEIQERLRKFGESRSRSGSEDSTSFDMIGKGSRHGRPLGKSSHHSTTSKTNTANDEIQERLRQFNESRHKKKNQSSSQHSNAAAQPELSTSATTTTTAPPSAPALRRRVKGTPTRSTSLGSTSSMSTSSSVQDGGTASSSAAPDPPRRRIKKSTPTRSTSLGSTASTSSAQDEIQERLRLFNESRSNRRKEGTNMQSQHSTALESTMETDDEDDSSISSFGHESVDGISPVQQQEKKKVPPPSSSSSSVPKTITDATNPMSSSSSSGSRNKPKKEGIQDKESSTASSSSSKKTKDPVSTTTKKNNSSSSRQQQQEEEDHDQMPKKEESTTSNKMKGRTTAVNDSKERPSEPPAVKREVEEKQRNSVDMDSSLNIPTMEDVLDRIKNKEQLSAEEQQQMLDQLNTAQSAVENQYHSLLNDRKQKLLDQKRQSNATNGDDEDDDEEKVEYVPKLSTLLAMGDDGDDDAAAKLQAHLDMIQQQKWNVEVNKKWHYKEVSFDGEYTCDNVDLYQVDIDNNDDLIKESVELFQCNPQKYIAMYYPNNTDGESKIPLTYVLRQGTMCWKPKNVKKNDTDGSHRLLLHSFKRLIPFPNNVLPQRYRDKYTDNMTYKKKVLHDNNKRKPILPGRGMYVGDELNLSFKLPTGYEPNDISQGYVQNCWLLSAIACLADYDWTISRLFRKTTNLSNADTIPGEKPTMYTVTLFDVKTWSEVDYEIDERLPIRKDKANYLLGAKPSIQNQTLWVCYLEKAVSIHCGGYDKLEGGQCIDAWPMLTGSRNQFTIMKNEGTGKYSCTAKYNPLKEEWLEYHNSPKDCKAAYYKVQWPKVGWRISPRGRSSNLELTSDELFQRMIAWNEHNMLLGAGSAIGSGSDVTKTNGIVDNHAYSIIDGRKNVCGTGIDLLLLRNPWGKGGYIKNGQFVRNGPGWDEYPNIRQDLNPCMDDNGIFWITKDEFFKHFNDIYLCTLNMAKLQDPKYERDIGDDFDRKSTNGSNQSNSNDDGDDKEPTLLDLILNEDDDDDESNPLAKNKSTTSSLSTTSSSSASSPPPKYRLVQEQYDGRYKHAKINREDFDGKSIAKAIKEFKSNPDKYIGMHFQTSALTDEWPLYMQSYTLIYREGTSGLQVRDVNKNGPRTFLRHVKVYDEIDKKGKNES